MIYLDNSATTPIHPKAREAMLPHLAEIYANPSGVYAPSRQSRKIIDEARQAIASVINATPAEIFFTSSGTESCNWAIKGIADKAKGKHIIISAIEHPAVANTCKYLADKGFEITTISVCADGFVSPQDIKEAIRPETCLVSVMTVSHEIGAIQPIAEISKIAKIHKIPVHTDAVQAVGKIPVDVDTLGVDLLSMSAHKFGGPKGIGVLYVRKGINITPLMHGGMQERGRRAGTENVLGIAGMSAALTAVNKNLLQEQSRIAKIRDYMIEQILTTIPYTKLNGPTGDARNANNINISFRFIEGESLLLHLDMHGIYASTGSACSSGSLEPSKVLMAIGLTHELANGAIRITLGHENTIDDVDALLKVLQPSVQKLRDLSPLYDDFMKEQK